MITKGKSVRHRFAVLGSGLLLLMLAACGTTQNLTKKVQFTPPPGPFKIALMKPDVQLSVLTAGGLEEPNAAWTDNARENLSKALVDQVTARGGTLSLMQDLTADKTLMVADFERLHRVVGATIIIHKMSMSPDLPTKKDTFDWTLGNGAQAIREATGADYALFLFARDSFSSGGRKALQVLGLASCAVGVCLAPGGGSQIAFVSLADLKTGNIIWFNLLAKQTGDLRDPAGAVASVSALIAEMPVTPAAAKK
jgi:hypothetical protein